MNISDKSITNDMTRDIVSLQNWLEQAVQVLKKASSIMPFLTRLTDSRKTIERYHLRHLQRMQERMDDPLLGGNNDELEDFSDVEPTVGVTSPAATLLTASDASDSKTCTVLNLASEACRGQVNMATEILGSNTDGKTNSNTGKEEEEKEEKEKEEQVME
jgi:hypothetical protein